MKEPRAGWKIARSAYLLNLTPILLPEGHFSVLQECRLGQLHRQSKRGPFFNLFLKGFSQFSLN